MKDKITYTKPNGTEITVNKTEANRDYAKKLGWKETNRIKKDIASKVDEKTQ